MTAPAADPRPLAFPGEAGARLPLEAAAWIGRQRHVTDLVRPRDLAAFRSTFAGLTAPGPVPPGFHWCLAPDLLPPDRLGRDGHARPGEVLPAMPLPRRMWAGGTLEHRVPLEAGDAVTRVSAVADIACKQGRSGPLWFVGVTHHWQVAGSTRIAERQDLVFRADPVPGDAHPPCPAAADWADARRWTLMPDATLLFRYSALTFNGHRIHYDHPYATAVEGYAGLVVHGPMQASLMLNLAATVLGLVPRRFAYRAQAPLIAGESIAVEARPEGTGLRLRVRRLGDGVATMTAEAEPD